MKTLCVLFTFLTMAALASARQSTQVEPKFQSESTRRPREKPLLFTEPAPPDKPNEIKRGKKTYSGIAVQVSKTKNPLQLINPFAPKEYGSGWDNTARDVMTGQVTGLNFFSVRWDWKPDTAR